MAKKKSVSKASIKKQIKQELAGKIEAAVSDFKEKLGKKKFEKRLKKATKLFVAGLPGKNFNGKTSGKAASKSVETVVAETQL